MLSVLQPFEVPEILSFVFRKLLSLRQTNRFTSAALSKSFLLSSPKGNINSHQNTGGQPTTVGAYAATTTSRSR